MKLNIVLIPKDLSPMIEHILRLEAFGGIFFSRFKIFKRDPASLERKFFSYGELDDRRK